MFCVSGLGENVEHACALMDCGPTLACSQWAYRLIWFPSSLVGTTAGAATAMVKFFTAFALMIAGMIAAAGDAAWSQANPQETLKVAIPQRGAWDAGVAELGQRG